MFIEWTSVFTFYLLLLIKATAFKQMTGSPKEVYQMKSAFIISGVVAACSMAILRILHFKEVVMPFGLTEVGLFIQAHSMKVSFFFATLFITSMVISQANKWHKGGLMVAGAMIGFVAGMSLIPMVLSLAIGLLAILMLPFV